MSASTATYVKDIFIHPRRAAENLRQADASALNRVTWWSFVIGVISYEIIVLIGYATLGWGAFPYREYYPHYFEPYWWEVFLVPVWAVVLGFGYAIPCYYLGKSWEGTATFKQVLAWCLLASVVSLPLFLAVDLYNVVRYPDYVIMFVTTGANPTDPAAYVNIVEWFLLQNYGN